MSRLILYLVLISSAALQAASLDPGAWQPASRVTPGGVLGERLRAWREGRLWRMVKDPFLLQGFESPPGTHPWQGEHAGKWLHAASLAYQATGDERLLAAIKATAGRLIASQQKNGYIGTYAPEHRFFAPPSARQRTSWDVWTARYTLYGLLAYESLQRDPAALDACVRLGDLLLATFGPGARDLTAVGTRHGMSSTVLLESIMMLYGRTGERRFLDFARHLHASIEANANLKLVSRLNAGVDVSIPGDGKAYQLMANLLGYGELYRATGNRSYLQANIKAWENIRSRHLFITGGPWGFKADKVKNVECFALPEYFDPGNPVETCTTTTWIQLSLQLLRLTGEARYGAEAERAIFNHLIGAQAADGVQWAYYTAANTGRRPYDDKAHCCGSSGPRALEQYAVHLIGTSGDALSLNSYLPLSAKLAAPGLPVSAIRIEGRYPFEDRAFLRLQLPSPSRFAVDFRVPSGAAGIEVMTGGRRQTLRRMPNGFRRLVRVWRPDETVLIRFEFPVRAEFRTGRDGRRWVAFTRGPFALAGDGEPEVELEPPRETADGRAWVAVDPEGRCRLKNGGAVLLPYYQAGGSGAAVRTYFPLASR